MNVGRCAAQRLTGALESSANKAPVSAMEPRTPAYVSGESGAAGAAPSNGHRPASFSDSPFPIPDSRATIHPHHLPSPRGLM